MNALETIRDMVAKGDELRSAHGRYRSISRPSDPFPHEVTDAQSELIYAAANARPALKLLVEIVEAAQEAQAEAVPHIQDMEATHGRIYRAGTALRNLRDLLAKLEEQ